MATLQRRVILRHELIITRGCSASLVRRRRVLLWRSRHRRQWAWLGFANIPRSLSRGRVPSEKLIAGTSGLVADMSTLRSAVLGEQTKPRAHAHDLALRDAGLETVIARRDILDRSLHLSRASLENR